jgi:RNA polymerase sigma-70 factor (sigma-E family)
MKWNLPQAFADADRNGQRLGDARAGQLPGTAQPDPVAAITVLYEEHALELIRIAHVMLGSKTSAEDAVQEAFYGLYHHWGRLRDQDRALSYLRSSVLNGCRSTLRRRARGHAVGPGEPTASSAEVAVLGSERRRAVMQALRQLPARQREALVLRFYLDESDAQIAAEMGIGESTVRSTIHRALAALGRSLGEMP